MQTSKEIVLNTIEHKYAERTPIGYMHILPEIASSIQKKYRLKDYEAVLQFLNLDYRKLKIPYLKKPTEAQRIAFETNYNRKWPEMDVKKPYYLMQTFGVEDGGSYSSGAAQRPFQGINSIKQIESYSWPDPAWLDYNSIAAEMELYQDKAIIAPDWSPVFGNVCEFFGMEDTLINLMLEPKLIEAAIEMITNYYLSRNKLLFEKCKGKFDIFLFGDDFASSRGLMISIETWRKFFKKPIKKLIDLAKSYGLKVHNHCCGIMHELIPEFIEMGIDVLEPCQFHLDGMDAKRMNEEYGKHITFYGGVDTQHTVPFGTPEDVRKEVRKNISAFPNGGYAVGSDHTLLPEFPLENILALYDEAAKQ